MHRIDWRVATAAACVGALLIVVGIVAFGGNDDTDETVSAGGDTAQLETTETQTATPAVDAPTPDQQEPTPAPTAVDDAASGADPTAAPTATSEPTATADPTSTPAPAAPTPEPTATSAPEPTTPPATDADTSGSGHPVPGEGCVVFLHGAGFPTPAYTEDWGDKTFIFPVSGNPEWPHFWLYDGPFLDYETDDTSYDAMVSIVRAAIDQNNCGPVFITGVSNGGGFLAKMYCRGEDFGGRLFAVHVDDPVPDAGVVGCSPSPSVIMSMFTHSTELTDQARALDNGRCTSTDSEYGPWYCDDDTALTLEAYEAEIGQQSIFSRTDHGGTPSDETSFWKIVTPWFHEYDPTRFNPQ